MLNPILVNIVTVVCLIALAVFVFRGRRYRKLWNRVVNLYEQGQYQDAIAVCDLILKWTPFSAYILYVQGIILFTLERYEESIANYDQALKYTKFVGGLDIYGALVARGDAFLELGKYREALDNYDQALKYQKGKERHPDENATIWGNRGVSQFNLNLYPEALYSFENSLKYNPDNWYCLTFQGSVFTDLQQYAEALQSLEQALDRHPEFAPAFYEKARCYALQGNIDRAMENLARSLALGAEEFRNYAKNDTDFDSIRSDDRFQALVHDTNKSHQGNLL
jgi:tetratricopeptide (TPR) repeat protein